MNARLDEPPDHCAGEAGRGKYAGALAKLTLVVPGAEDIVGTDEGGGLGYALEEADGHDALGVVHGGGHHSQAGPDQHAGREEVSRLHIVQRQVGGDLADDVADREAGVDHVQLVAHEAEVFLHARDVGIAEVGSVQLLFISHIVLIKLTTSFWTYAI